MVNFKDDAIFDVRAKLWDELVSTGIFLEEDYYSDNLQETIIPIFPVQQQPEMDQFLNGKKHIVYDKISTKIDVDWFITRDQILFTLYSTQYDEVIEMLNLIIDLFRRFDDSADETNSHGAASHGLGGPHKFHSISVVDINPISPSEELQGYFEGQIVIEAMYSRKISPIGRYI